MTSGNGYAAAMFMLASEENKLKEFSDDLDVIEKVFRENPDYSRLLSSPDIPKFKRLSAIDAAFGGKVGVYAQNFIKVLCEHNRIDSIEECIKEFAALKKAAENSVTAKVYTAVPLGDVQKLRLKEKLEKRLGVNIIIKPIIDKKMIGGVKIELDGKVLDGSIKRQLHDIKEVISK